MIADHRRGAGHEAFHRAGRLHHAGETGRRDHDEADLRHHPHAFGKHVVLLPPAEHAAGRQQREAEQTAQHHRIRQQLDDQGADQRRSQHDLLPAAKGAISAGRRGLLAVLLAYQRPVFVGALAAIAEKDGNEQAQCHAADRDRHRQRHLGRLDLQAEFRTAGVEIVEQNVVEKDRAEPDRQQHVGRRDPEGNDTGHRATIQPEPVHQRQQRRHQDRNEGDVDGNQVLRADRRQQQAAQQGQHHAAPTGAGALEMESLNGATGQRLGDARA